MQKMFQKKIFKNVEKRQQRGNNNKYVNTVFSHMLQLKTFDVSMHASPCLIRPKLRIIIQTERYLTYHPKLQIEIILMSVAVRKPFWH